jgi:predicted MFS family arabinose efflux permease
VFGGAMVIHLMPDLIVSIGIEAESHGELLASWRGVIIASYLVMYLFSFWHFRFSVSVVSQLLGASGLFVIALAESNSMLLLGLALQGQLVGFNYYSGLFYSTAGSKQEGRALAAGIHEATLAAGMALGTIAGGWLGSFAGTRAPYRMAGGFILAMVVVQLAAWQLWKRGKR